MAIPDYQPYFRIERPLLVTMILTLAVISYGTLHADKITSAAAAIVFAQSMIWTGVRATALQQRSLKTSAIAEMQSVPSAALSVVRQTTRLTAITMLWGAAALLLAYPMLGLKWQHGWQYGLGSAVIAVAFAQYAQRLANSADRLAQPGALQMARRLSGVLALAIAVACGWLIISGKLLTQKNDWLANDVFLAVAASVFALSLLSFVRAR